MIINTFFNTIFTIHAFLFIKILIISKKLNSTYLKLCNHCCSINIILNDMQ